jgi:hypothetical protein
VVRTLAACFAAAALLSNVATADTQRVVGDETHTSQGQGRGAIWHREVRVRGPELNATEYWDVEHYQYDDRVVLLRIAGVAWSPLQVRPGHHSKWFAGVLPATEGGCVDPLMSVALPNNDSAQLVYRVHACTTGIRCESSRKLVYFEITAQYSNNRTSNTQRWNERRGPYDLGAC